MLDGWPEGMRLIVRKERPHPGAQLRFTDADGMRLTAFATDIKNVPIAALELRHRQRARAEDRIRAARATGLTNLPLHDVAQNRIWLEIVQIALDLLAWMPMLALTGQARLWEPRRLRLRLFSAAAQLVTTGRRRILRLAAHWTDLVRRRRSPSTRPPQDRRPRVTDHHPALPAARRTQDHGRRGGALRTPQRGARTALAAEPYRRDPLTSVKGADPQLVPKNEQGPVSDGSETGPDLRLRKVGTTGFEPATP